MNKLIGFSTVLMILLSSFVMAYNAPLSDFDFNGISIDSSLKTECKTITVDITDKNAQGVGILSINASFFGEKSDSSRVSVRIDEGDAQLIWPEFFSCKELCWARIFLPDISEKKTNIELCLTTGGATTSANISPTSFIGTYDSPLLSVTNVSPEQIILGDKANMTVTVKNEGTKAADVFVQFVSQDLRSFIEITSFDIVEGSSNATINILPGEEEKFSFAIRPAKASSYNLPYSIIRFQNVFGEQQTIASKHPQLNVVEGVPVEVNLVSTEMDKKLKITAIVKNNLSQPFSGTLIVTPADLLSSSRQEVLVPYGEEQQVILLTQTLPAGEYNFSAKIIQKDTNNEYVSNSINYIVKKDSVPIEIILAILAIIAAVAVFFTINAVKHSKKN